ncbi:MAG TPA: metallophosphoesterase [Capillimicrobium sp.]|nr:metallophosphoesterase [Capillimicrobium sp.]
MRILALADAPPRRPVAELVAAHEPALVVLLGDLQPSWVADLSGLDVPRLGVHGNHDEPGLLTGLGVQDVHLRSVEVDGLRFTGLSGSPAYSRGASAFEWTEPQADALVARLPDADVLLTHTPPLGVDDEPDDPVHRGFAALVPWVERHQPRWLLHGHTQPDPRRRVPRVGATRVVHVRGDAVLEL